MANRNWKGDPRSWMARRNRLRHSSLKVASRCVIVARRRGNEFTGDWVLRGVLRVPLLLNFQLGLLPSLLNLDDLVQQFAELDEDPVEGVSDIPGSRSR